MGGERTSSAGLTTTAPRRPLVQPAPPLRRAQSELQALWSRVGSAGFQQALGATPTPPGGRRRPDASAQFANSGIFEGLEAREGVVYAKYKAKLGTWVSASLLEHGYDRTYGPAVAYGAYLGLVTDLAGRPLADPDSIFPGQGYMFPVGTSVEFEAEVITGYRLPAVVTAQEPWRESAVKHWVKSKVMPPDPDHPYPSFELRGPEPPSREPRAAVAYWLGLHAIEIVAAESRWGVSRSAIAGIIAWEALENPQGWSVSSHGPGKMHEDADLWAGAVGQLFNGKAEAGRQDLHHFGHRPSLSITYIGAALFLIARGAEKAGYNIRNQPEILAQVYHGHSPASWEEKISTKKSSEPFELVPGGMGFWILQNKAYLEGAVGHPNLQ